MSEDNISAMDKHQLLNYMKSSREIQNFNDESKAWQHAFNLCKKATGLKLDMDCSSCVRKVHEWLTNEP